MKVVSISLIEMGLSGVENLFWTSIIADHRPFGHIIMATESPLSQSCPLLSYAVSDNLFHAMIILYSSSSVGHVPKFFSNFQSYKFDSNHFRIDLSRRSIQTAKVLYLRFVVYYYQF